MKTKAQPKVSVLLDKLADLGWEYTCNTMTRSGMQTYDEIMQYMGVLEEGEHWNEDAYQDKNCDHSMKFLVTDIEFDFDDDYPEDITGNTEHICNNDLDTYFIASNWDRQEIVDGHLGVWEADDEDDLIEELTAASGWCIKKIDYHIQLK